MTLLCCLFFLLPIYTSDVVFFFPRFEHYLQFTLRIKFVLVKSSVVLSNSTVMVGKLDSSHYIKPVLFYRQDAGKLIYVYYLTMMLTSLDAENHMRLIHNWLCCSIEL